ncbi:GDP-6-deoxy-D-lyxo-4-hexulose reductase [Burkholderia lata]|uniref:NAD-dependent epimerase/dehydratase family protein n=1 Tax=Burkholderia lata (strain ATCC 17760 / DSM 23089 / LMG 22485 / NCIMB 9086 / R18194 / 383) TaxID=482957 RepID=UPI0014542E3C|nr:NAD-dependent epimerase/dehydratase family protein [Burkholderia lata]VWB54483.1 GDP-6-deoxy-D-lyxo-4-hexulose reductase [Burkholderia lata]
MSKILITGIRGFTGQHLVKELLAEGHEVCGLSHAPASEDTVPIHVCDLLDRDSLADVLTRERPQAIIHMAAIAFVAHGDVRAIYDTNVVGTRNLLDAIHATDCRPQAVLLPSSANVYGNSDQEIIDESTAPNPANDYAVSKLAMEYVARLWMDKLPITIVRPFNYTGVGQPANFLLPKIVAHFKERKATLELGNLDVIRDFSDVRNVVAAYGKLLSGEFAGQIFNVCSGIGYALRDILGMMEVLTGHSPEIRVNPAFVRASEVRKLIGSNERLTRAIGALPTISLSDTLRWMLESDQ